MKLYYNKNAKDPTYYAQVGIRNGKKTTTKNVKNFGKHSELLKITDDPEAYVREEIRKMNEEYRVGKEPFELTADFNARVKKSGDEASSSAALNIGYFFLQDVMKDLGLKEFFRQAAAGSELPFDSFTAARFLVYARILRPGSGLPVRGSLSSYYEQPEFEEQHIRQVMDLLADNYDGYLAWLCKKSRPAADRDTSVLYYDFTDCFAYGRRDGNPADRVTGGTVPGMGEDGTSEEPRPNPVVGMGLFTDSRGVPLTMCLRPGDPNGGNAVTTPEEEVREALGASPSRIICCGDAGRGLFRAGRPDSMGGQDFVVTRSVKELGPGLREAALDDRGYRLLSSDSPVQISDMISFDPDDSPDLYNDLAYKVICADSGLSEDKARGGGGDGQAETGRTRQRVIITFSRKAMEYQRAARSRQTERAGRMLETCGPEEIHMGPDGGGKEAGTCCELDRERIEEEEKFDGFRAVVTDLDDPVKDILEISHERRRIRGYFRVMGAGPAGRPVNCRPPRRAEAHYLLCYTALLVTRLLEVRLAEQGTRVKTGDLVKTLRNMNVVNVHDVEYMALYTGSRVLSALTDLTSLQLDRIHYTPKELNKMIREMLK